MIMELNRVSLGSVVLGFLLLVHASNANILKRCQFDAIYQLGDSISDTGNLIREDPSSLFARPPYGETYFNRSTGRCSNGLLMIDFIARSAGIPLLDAYLNPNTTFNGGRGVNFAVAGSTALPVNVLAQSRILSPATNSSLSTQLDWMSTYFNKTCYNDTDREEKIKSALFMVGEIGGNDYNYAFFQGKAVEEVMSMVPNVVQAIKDAVEKVIGFGGRKIIVPGNFPIGCLPIYLTGFHNNDTSSYGELHCLKGLNNFSMYHNEKLQAAIQELKIEHPNVTIVYGDYYNAYLWVLRNAPRLGFDRNSTQKACCGSGGDYNFSLTKLCGVPSVPVCPNPNKSLSWDGIHSTQRAYYFMAGWLIRHIFPQLQCLARP